MIHFVNFADERFRGQQERSSYNALHVGGVDKVYEFAPKDISSDFVQQNAKIFSNKRGRGLWLWKPYLINKLAESLSDGEIIVYSDSGVSFIRNISPLIKSLEESESGMLFFGLPLLSVEWTKNEAFVEADYSPEIGELQVDGSFFIIRLSSRSRKLIKDWLDLCCNEVILSPDKFRDDIVESSKFQSHREDQSVLSMVVHRNSIALYRDPSDYGEFPFQYRHPRNKWSYCPQKFSNSSYPTLTIHHRSADFDVYYRTYKQKHMFAKFGLWNEWISRLKNKLH